MPFPFIIICSKLNRYKFIADAILSSNLGIPFRGTAIGNGWMDSRRQYPAYLEYAVKHGIVEEGSAVSFVLLSSHRVFTYEIYRYIAIQEKQKGDRRLRSRDEAYDGARTYRGTEMREPGTDSIGRERQEVSDLSYFSSLRCD